MDFQRNFFRPNEPLQTFGRTASGAPTARGLADVQTAVGRKGHAVVARLEIVAKGEAGTLKFTVHFFETDTHHIALGLVANKHLAGEGTELSSSGVHER